MRVLEIRSPPWITSSTPWAAKPSSLPSPGADPDSPPACGRRRSSRRRRSPAGRARSCRKLAHELARRHPGELGGEADDEQHVDPRLVEQRLLLLRGGQADRRLLGASTARGWGSKVMTTAGTPSSAGPRHDPVEDRPLAAVDAVEVADRGDAAARQVAAVVRVVDDEHGEGSVIRPGRLGGTAATTRADVLGLDGARRCARPGRRRRPR